MKIIKLEVGKKAFLKEIDETDKLSAMQEEVGGLIELILLEDGVAMVVNEEGLINGSKLNRIVKDKNDEVITIAAGNCFICGDTGEDLTSIPEDKIRKYIERYIYPQHFFKCGNKIMAQQYDPEKRVAIEEPEIF